MKVLNKRLIKPISLMIFLSFLTGSLFAQYTPFKIHFFKPNDIKQIRIYQVHNVTPSVIVMEVYLKQNVAGKAGFVKNSTCDDNKGECLARYRDFLALGEKIKNGSIKGITYLPQYTLYEHSSLYFEKKQGTPLYVIYGFYLYHKMEMAQFNVQVMQPQHIQQNQQEQRRDERMERNLGIPNISGTWRSNKGFVLDIMQNGKELSWKIKSKRQSGDGSIIENKAAFFGLEEVPIRCEIMLTPEGTAHEMSCRTGIVLVRE